MCIFLLSATCISPLRYHLDTFSGSRMRYLLGLNDYLSYVPRQSSILFRLTHTKAGNTFKCRFLSSSGSYHRFSRRLE